MHLLPQLHLLNGLLFSQDYFERGARSCWVDFALEPTRRRKNTSKCAVFASEFTWLSILLEKIFFFALEYDAKQPKIAHRPCEQKRCNRRRKRKRPLLSEPLHTARDKRTTKNHTKTFPPHQQCSMINENSDQRVSETILRVEGRKKSKQMST